MPVWRRTVGRLLVGAIVMPAAVGLSSGTAHAEPDDQLAPLHSSAEAAIPGSYIIVYKKHASPAAKDRVESGVRSRGGQINRRFTAGLLGFSAKLSGAALNEVRRDPNVAYVEINGVARLDATASWGLDRINQRSLPLSGTYGATANGSAVHVYVIDSGVRTTHTEFGGRATLDADFVDDIGSDDCNPVGHGTHVSGTVGGATVGVARSVRIHGVRVFGCSMTGTFEALIGAIDWVTAHALRPAVINMSLTAVSVAVEDATNAAISAGITTVVAAGNFGLDACGFAPANVPRAITVANSTQADVRRSDSNFGACVDLFAPGDNIVSASNLSDTGTRTLGGTSMASPHVAGVAALYLQRHRNATPQQVHDFIVRTATVGVIGDVRGSPNRLLYSTFDTASDYNRDGASDYAVWRPSNGTWFVRDVATVQWGVAGDIPVPADYNGDGATDYAVWRPLTGTWFVRNVATVQWGALGDIPVPGDYNRDGIADLAVWRPSTGTWFVRNIATVQWGVLGDIPVPADYNGDGFTDLAVWRPSTGTWFVLGILTQQWGLSGDIPAPADYTGDGVAELVVWRPSTGTWFNFGIGSLPWGTAGDIPAPRDFTGDGQADAPVWRPSNGTWFVFFVATVQWGVAGDIPV